MITIRFAGAVTVKEVIGDRCVPVGRCRRPAYRPGELIVAAGSGLVYQVLALRRWDFIIIKYPGQMVSNDHDTIPD